MKLPKVVRAVPRWGVWTMAGVLGLFLMLFIVSFFIDEPLRRTVEARMNRDLTGYSVRLPGLHFQLIGLSVTFKDLRVLQQAHPDPPVAVFPRLFAHVHLKGLLHGRLVAEFDLDRPRLHVNLAQLMAEKKDSTKVEDRGWQQALEDMYPLKINHVSIKDGDVVYIDEDPNRPLHLSQVNAQAENIRNVASKDRVYPSKFQFRSVVFDSGQAVINGNANFLAEPTPAIKGTIELRSISLDYFKPVLARSNLLIEGGALNATGEMEYAPTIKTAYLKELRIEGLRADYVHTAVTAGAEQARAKKVGRAAREATNNPTMELRVDHFEMVNSTLGMINKALAKPYRVYLADADLTLSNLSNHFSEGPAELHLEGKFMGNGPTAAQATFRPEKQGPDFDLNLKIENTKLRTMNDLLRAYGNFDVTAGMFSFYTQLSVKNQHIAGYVKPLFRDMKVYDSRQDKDKGFLNKVYQKIVGGVGSLLENAPRAEVATKTSVSGPVSDPHTNTWQVIAELVRNAFFKAILPGFERQASGTRG